MRPGDLRREASNAALSVTVPFLLGAAVTFPFALRAALRRYPKEP